MLKEVIGDLIQMAHQGKFDVIAHGCNCFCTMGAGIAPQMAEAFGAHKFPLESKEYRGDINKLGQIDSQLCATRSGAFIAVVNCYTQYGFGMNHANGTVQPLDYTALKMCFKKMNYIFKGKTIGLPWIGCGLAGGDIEFVKTMIETIFTDCDVILVEYDKSRGR